MNDTQKRTVYIDANVINQINRGNRDAANALHRMIRDPNVVVRVPPWVRRELVDQPAIPRTATANRLMLEELRIQQGAAPNLAQRVDVTLDASTSSGESTVSIRDRQIIASARAGNAEIWSFDKTFRKYEQMIQTNHGVRVAQESQSVPMVHGNRADYRIGRQLMGLEPVDISLHGNVTRSGAGRGSASQGPAAPVETSALYGGRPTNPNEATGFGQGRGVPPSRRFEKA